MAAPHIRKFGRTHHRETECGAPTTRFDLRPSAWLKPVKKCPDCFEVIRVRMAARLTRAALAIEDVNIEQAKGLSRLAAVAMACPPREDREMFYNPETNYQMASDLEIVCPICHGDAFREDGSCEVCEPEWDADDADRHERDLELAQDAGE